MKDNSESIQYLLFIWHLIEGINEEWDKYREKAMERSDSNMHELEEYFEKVFQDNIPQYELKMDTQLYRARQIKSDEWNDVGVSFDNLGDEFFKIFLTQDDIDKAKNENLKISLQTLFYIKSLGLKEFEKSQLEKVDELINKNSIQDFFYGFPASGSGVPPKEYRTDGRLNTKDDEYLYLALEKDTAIYEMRPSVNQTYSVSLSQVNKKLVLADLRGWHEKDAQGNYLLRCLADKISEPNTDKNNKFYHITQLMSHWLQSKKFDGILYDSSIKKEGTNVMLYDENSVNFLSSEIITINAINVNYTTELPFQNIPN